MNNISTKKIVFEVIMVRAIPDYRAYSAQRAMCVGGNRGRRCVLQGPSTSNQHFGAGGAVWSVCVARRGLRTMKSEVRTTCAHCEFFAQTQRRTSLYNELSNTTRASPFLMHPTTR